MLGMLKRHEVEIAADWPAQSSCDFREWSCRARLSYAVIRPNSSGVLELAGGTNNQGATP